MTIYKYKISQMGFNLIQMPQGAEILSAGVDAYERICLWALVEPSAPLVDRQISLIGTGWDLGTKEDTLSLGSFVSTLKQEPYIWHIFDGGEVNH